MRILDPERPPAAAPADAPNPSAGSLSGKTLAIVSNPWRSFRIWQEEFATLAVSKYEAKAVLKPKNPEDAAKAPDYCIDEALEADLVIDGLGF